MHNRNRIPSRGVAMMMVLISLMTATVLTTAYVASRDNSAAIGENVLRAAEARWASESAIELGVAILQTQAPWRNSPGGVLIDNQQVGNALITVTATDLLTNSPPGDDTKDVLLTAKAVVGGIEQSATAVVHVQHDEAFAVDVDLSEFAAFTAHDIQMSDNALICRWPTAPMSSLGKPLAIGTQQTSSGSIVMNDDAAAVDTHSYVPPFASSGLALLSGATSLVQNVLNDTIPIPNPPSPDVPLPNLLTPYPNLTVSATISSSSRRNRIELPANTGLLQLNNNLTLVAEDDLILRTGSGIKVNGNTKIVVFGKLIMEENSFIEVHPERTLEVYVKQDAALNSAYIGEKRTSNVLNNTGSASYFNPEKIKLYTIPALLSNSVWKLEGNSVVQSEAYLKDASVEIRNTSALYGRVVAKELKMREQAALFYDPGLNNNLGYTNSSSLLYTANGEIVSAFKTLPSLASSALNSVSSVTGVVVKCSNSAVYGIAPAEIVADEPMPGDPTPRPVQVSFTVQSYGSSVKLWEN